MVDYTVSSKLQMASNVPELLATMVRSFETVNRLVSETQDKLSGLRNDLRVLSEGNRGINAIVRSLQRLSEVKLGGGLLTDMREMSVSVREMSVAQAEMARSAQRTVVAYRELASSGRQATGSSRTGGTGRNHVVSHGTLLDAGMGAGMAGDVGVGFFERSLHQSFEVAHVASLLTQDDRVTPALLAAARARAQEVTKLVPGSTEASNLELIREALRNYGDPQEAISSLLPFARAQLALRLQSQKQGGSGSASGAMDALFKSIEDLGLDIDRSDPSHPHVAQEKLEAAVNLITRMTVGSQGGVDPTKLLAFVKQARVAGISMSEEGLKNYVGLMQGMTASRSGTALAGFFNQFLVGTMTQNVFRELQKQRVYDSSAKWSHGRVQDASKHLANSQLAQTDIVSWFQATITPELLKQGALTHAADGALAVAKGAGRQTTGGLLAELAVAMAQIMKQRGNLDHTSADPVQHALDTDPETKILAFRTAENNLLVKAGELISGPALTGLTKLTDALQAIADWAAKHPDTGKDLLVTAAGLSVLAAVAGVAANVIFIGAPIVLGIRALASAATLFALGTPAGLALIALTAGLLALSKALSGFHMPDNLFGPPSPSEQNRMQQQMRRDHPSSMVPQYDPDTGRPIARRESYIAPPGGQTLQPITINLDGEVIYQNQQRYRAREMSRPNSGASTFDGRLGIPYQYQT